MAATSLDTGKVIYDVLSTDTTLVNLLGSVTKIQPSAIYTASPKEGIYYDILSVENANTKTANKSILSTVTFQIECFMPVYRDTLKVGARVQYLLDKLAHATYKGVPTQGCIMTGQSTDFDGNNQLYYLQMSFSIRILT